MSTDVLPMWLVHGGWVLWVLTAVSIISVATILYVAVRHAGARLGLSARGMERLVESALEGEPDARGSRRIYARIASTAGALAAEGMSGEEARSELASSAAEALNELRSGMRMLEVIASTAPLMGLLGTVLGMIDAFKQLEQAGNQIDPSLLSAGIWQALLTTAAGLIVALPALVAWHLFDRRLETARVTVNLLLSKLTGRLFGFGS